jgi:hypothetical protein
LNYLPGLALNHDLPDLYSQAARITDHLSFLTKVYISLFMVKEDGLTNCFFQALRSSLTSVSETHVLVLLKTEKNKNKNKKPQILTKSWALG